jgi:hypothetical protein
MKRLHTILLGLLLLTAVVSSCKKDDDNDKDADFKNEFIKKSQSPLMVGERIEFAYGMGTINGKLTNVRAVASIPGATGTLWEPFTWTTGIVSGTVTNISTVVATVSPTVGNTSSAVVIDKNATTLRYFYVVPESARGQDISFEFSADNSLGATVSTKTQNYHVTRMDMVRNITVTGTATGARYFSIADGKAYTQAEVDAGNISGKIDFVYAYAATITPTTIAYTYGHSLVSPSEATYFPAGFTITPSWTKRTTKMERKIGTMLFDGQLKGDANIGVYVDEIDLAQQDFTTSANFVLTLTADGGVFMKTADGKYVAYIYVNSLNNAGTSAIISMKRLQMF